MTRGRDPRRSSGLPISPQYEAKETADRRATILQRVERDIMLQVVDAQWKDHLYSLDHLKEGIGLRGYGQRDPLVEYKKESFALFQAMKERVDEEMVRYLWRLRPVVDRGRRRRRRGAARAGAAPRRRMITPSGPSRALPPSPFGGAQAARRRRGVGSGPPQPGARRRRRAAVKTVGATSRRSAATTRARAAAARSTRSATARQPEPGTTPSLAATSCPTTTRMASRRHATDDRSRLGLATALTFDDVLLVPQHSHGAAEPGGRQHAAHAQHPR